jgi:Holliday junction resolvase RusA-like endonuclease
MDNKTKPYILKLKIPGTLRIKKNSKRIFKNKGRKGYTVLPSEAYEEWNYNTRALIGNAFFESMDMPYSVLPLTKLISVEVHVYYKGPQMDLSGALESIGDTLEGLIWKNDKQIMSWDGSRLHHDKENPRTEVFVRGFDE